MNRNFLVLSLVFFGMLPAEALAQKYCNAAEKPVLSCQIKDKRAELCYSKNKNNFVYRFKKFDAIQLQYPQKSNSTDPFKFSSTPYSGGGEDHIRFENGGYTYFIYDKNVKESDGNLNSTAGIMVKKDKTVTDMQCENEASIHSEVYELIPKEDYKDIGVQ